MGVAEIEYTWVYPANWHFSGEPWRIRWLQIPYLQAKPRRELHFFLCLRTVRAASFQRWGTHAAIETGIKSQNASPECSVWNSKRCYMKQDVQHAPQAKDAWNVHQVLQATNSPATHTVFFPCRSNSYGTNALTKSSGIRQIWWTIHIKNTPARDLQQCGG